MRNPSLTQNTEHLEHSPLFSTKAMRKAIQSLETVLSHVNLDAIIYDLENYGLPLTNDHKTYSLAQIQSAFEKTFGNEAALLFFRRISQELFSNK